MDYKTIKEQFNLIHGPCTIESLEQMEEVVENLKGISNIFRAGSYKPRTSPESFQGLKEEGLGIVKELKSKNDIYICSEIVSIKDVDKFKDVDIIQIGARNMQNFELLTEVAKLNKIILLKRGFGNTVEELIASTEYILKEGNDKIILCERGIRTFSNTSRFTLDLSAVGYLKDNTNFPIFVDPSHAGGNKKEVMRLTKAAYAYGCDGLLIEVHPNPEEAQSDKNQQLNISQYKSLIESLKTMS